jgi:hypothetical protein
MLRVYRNILEHETETAKDEPDRARLIFRREQAIALVMLCMAEGPDLDALGIALVIQSVKSSTSVH